MVCLFVAERGVIDRVHVVNRCSRIHRDKHFGKRLLADGMGSLVVLLLAERAPWEGPRSTRALED